MLGLDKKTLHALQAMLTISSHVGVQPISGKEIAAEHALTPRYLEQMLQRLVRAKILHGVRGPRGGYVLAREKRHISMADIVEDVKADNDETSNKVDYAGLNQLLAELQGDITEKLKSVTLQELTPKKVVMKKTADFTI